MNRSGQHSALPAPRFRQPPGVRARLAFLRHITWLRIQAREQAEREARAGSGEASALMAPANRLLK